MQCTEREARLITLLIALSCLSDVGEAANIHVSALMHAKAHIDIHAQAKNTQAIKLAIA